jgi:hypothetical protein
MAYLIDSICLFSTTEYTIKIKSFGVYARDCTNEATAAITPQTYLIAICIGIVRTLLSCCRCCVVTRKWHRLCFSPYQLTHISINIATAYDFYPLKCVRIATKY